MSSFKILTPITPPKPHRVEVINPEIQRTDGEFICIYANCKTPIFEFENAPTPN
jgi:hypothetical protein